MRTLLVNALAAVRDRRLLLLHVVANAVLSAGTSFWFLIPDARTWQLLVTAVSAVLLLFGFAWLHCGTLVRGFDGHSATLRESFRRSLPRIPLFLLLFVAMVWLMREAGELAAKSWQISGYLFTLLPEWAQTRTGELTANNWINFTLDAAVWFVVPALFLPLLSAVSALGLRRRTLTASWKTLTHWQYWVLVGAIALMSVWLPRVLIAWRPGYGLRQEFVSMLLRFVLAYLLMISGWLAASAIAGSLVRRHSDAELVREPLS